MSLSHSKTNPSYDFLDIRGETEAVAGGLVTIDRLTFPVFRAIHSRSSLQNARDGTLFSVDMEIPSLPGLDHRDRLTILQKLIDERLVAQIFYIRTDKGNLQLVPCYIAKHLKKDHNPHFLYNAAIFASVRATEAFLSSLSSLDAKDVTRLLTRDYNSDADFSSAASALVVDPLTLLKPNNFALPPSAQLLEHGRQDLRNEMQRSKKMVEILHYGMMLLKPLEVFTNFDPARKFVTEKLQPGYSAKYSALKEKLEQIDLDETLYYLKPFAVETVKFDVQKAEAIKNAILAAPDSFSKRFPGSLAIEIVLALKNTAESFLIQQHRQKVLASYNNIRAALFTTSESWSNAILPLSGKKQEEIDPETWEYLLQDKDLLYGNWNQRDQVVHVFVRKDPDILYTLVQNMAKSSFIPAWQNIVLGRILEKNRMELQGLFGNHNFMANYKTMLWRGYRLYYPWYYRLLLFFGINFFSKSMLQIAKYKVEDIQENFRKLNEISAEEKRREKDILVKKAYKDVYLQKLKRNIVKLLDHFYMNLRQIPTLSEVKKSLAEKDQSQLPVLLKNKSFQVISLPGKENSEDDNEDDNIVLYGFDQDWPPRATRLSRLINDILEQKEQPDKTLMERAGRLQSFLRLSAKSPPSMKTVEKDPFERFKEELKKYEVSKKEDKSGTNRDKNHIADQPGQLT